MIVSSSRDKSIPIETVTKISDLPENLVEEILSRVPLKSMRAVRLTCKQWHSLSKSQSFSKMHIGKLTEVKEGESTIVVMMNHNLYLMKVVLGEDPFIECQGRLDKQIRISEVFHCDGLLLCVPYYYDTKYIVWDPYLGQTRSIESTYSHGPYTYRWDWFTYALGYEEKGSSFCRGYKLLRFIDKYHDTFSCYEIYDFDSSSWKTLDINRPHWRILCNQRGVSLNGNTYWPASHIINTYKYDVLDDHIICFDFTSESFGPLLRLPFDVSYDEDSVTLSCVRDEKLAVLLTHNNEGDPPEFEIWISTKIEAEKVSWSKFLEVETEMGFYAMVYCDTFFIDEDMKIAMAYTITLNIVGEDGYLNELEFVEHEGRDVKHFRVMVCSYVPSLVQIKQPAAGGGQQSRLRKATI